MEKVNRIDQIDLGDAQNQVDGSVWVRVVIPMLKEVFRSENEPFVSLAVATALLTTMSLWVLYSAWNAEPLPRMRNWALQVAAWTAIAMGWMWRAEVVQSQRDYWIVSYQRDTSRLLEQLQRQPQTIQESSGRDFDGDQARIEIRQDESSKLHRLEKETSER